MPEIRNLKNIEIDKIVDVFNLSFSDYVLPVLFTREQLQEKMINENANPEYSVGVFKNEHLVAFMLHCSKVKDGKITVYNAGTGVIPAERGNGWTLKMYEFILPVLKAENVVSIQLEAFSGNIPAIKTYKKVGFEKQRDMNCYRGKMQPSAPGNKSEIREIKNHDWNLLSSFWDFEPTWQNSIEVMDKLSSTAVSYGAFVDGMLVGYIIFNTKSKRVHQFGVDKRYRQRSIGRDLFACVSENQTDTISIINVNETAKTTCSFLVNMGLENYINQVEMKLVLNAG